MTVEHSTPCLHRLVGRHPSHRSKTVDGWVHSDHTSRSVDDKWSSLFPYESRIRNGRLVARRSPRSSISDVFPDGMRPLVGRTDGVPVPPYSSTLFPSASDTT